MFRSIRILGGPIHAGKSYEFQSGCSAIVGPNGCGKSLLAEYLAFSLFGSVALRGRVADYKGLSVVTNLAIKDKEYQIARTTSNCTIKCENEILCVGTKVCNAKIITLLGYDYNVYKMGNYAEQLDILGLGKLKPSERKTAIDRTLGIGIMDKLIKYCNDNALKYKHESDGLRIAMIEPGERPVEPEGYCDINILSGEYAMLKAELEDYGVFKNMVEPVEPLMPFEPEKLRGYTAEEARKEYDRCSKTRCEIELLEKVEKPLYNMEFLESVEKANEKYSKYLDYLAIKTRILGKDYEEPIIDLATIENLEYNQKEWENFYTEQLKYEQSLITCPECGKQFSLNMQAPVPPAVADPKVDCNWLKRQRDLNLRKQEFAKVEVVEPAEEPRLNSYQVNQYKCICGRYEMAQLRIKALATSLIGYEDFTYENVEAKLKYETDMALYMKDLAVYEDKAEVYKKLASQFDSYNEAKKLAELNDLANRYNNNKDYDYALSEWNKVNDRYQEIKKKVEELESKESRYRKGAEELKDVKTKIKGYVLPSLQKVSSHLLSEMSDGLYSSISIDPEFNILVEGREVNLFSGSEQAMINLALRLGLGQVLTHKAFSVFIGDEIDASMREERAQLTADCLKSISKHIEQVLLISHRDIEADNYINLGD